MLGIKFSHHKRQTRQLKMGLSFQIADIVKAVGNCSYNQLVEKIICCKQSDNRELVDEGGRAAFVVETSSGAAQRTVDLFFGFLFCLLLQQIF